MPGAFLLCCGFVIIFLMDAEILWGMDQEYRRDDDRRSETLIVELCFEPSSCFELHYLALEVTTSLNMRWTSFLPQMPRDRGDGFK